VLANQRALQQLVDQGVSLRETQLKKALADIEKMEETLFASVRKAAPADGPWSGVFQAMQGKGTGTGARANAALEQLVEDTQKSLRDGRAMGLRASQALIDSYSTLVSGVLIGMSDALKQGGAAQR